MKYLVIPSYQYLVSNLFVKISKKCFLVLGFYHKFNHISFNGLAPSATVKHYQQYCGLLPLYTQSVVQQICVQLPYLLVKSSNTILIKRANLGLYWFFLMCSLELPFVIRVPIATPWPTRTHGSIISFPLPLFLTCCLWHIFLGPTQLAAAAIDQSLLPSQARSCE